MIYSFELILSFISYTKLFDLILSCMIRLICTCPALICTCPTWSAWSAWSVLLELLLPFEAIVSEWSSSTSADLLPMQFSRTAFTIHHFLFVKAVQAGDLHAVQYFLSFCGKSRRSACTSHPPTFGGVDLLFFLFDNK